MTAAATDEIRTKCLGVGMDDYLTKPLGDMELERTLALWLPQVGAATSVAALDVSRIERLRSLFPGEEATTMLIRIANEVTNELARLDGLLAAGEHEAAAGAAHSIRGSAQMVGATKLADAAVAVEDAVHEQPPSDGRIAEAVAELRERWAETRRGIESQVEADRREYHPPDAAD
jgi:HPt (histidine-containing phosphotransfer) domain-containing protein